ncbi:AAA family ATPase [Paenisporosarcina sp. NPDC076898]|uniref:ATP-binding protein n=1 Tax=unclassified Paenisporosarcina TaxID=2642018 RepID=UPI003D03F44D
MGNYKIKRIYIENFKHIQKLEMDFLNKDFIVLDGPNGFGKTTIFDAIELVLSGVISRVSNTADGRFGYNDLLFSNNKKRDTIIKIEFCNEEETFTVAKRFNSQIPLNALDRKPDNWGLFETHLLQEFYSPCSGETIIDLVEINKKLGFKNLNRYFSLFYYVQQEENTYFLKQPAKERMDVISQLFDTKTEEQELYKFKKIKIKLEKEFRTLNNPKGQLNEKQRLLKSLTIGISQVQKEQLKNVEYFSLFPEDKIKKDWDKEDIIVQKETRDRYLQELREIYRFSRDFNEFIKVESNLEIQKYVENHQLLSSTIIGYEFLNEYSSFRELVVKEDRIRKLKEKLSIENLKENLKVFPFAEIESLVDIESDINTISQKVDVLKSYKQRMGELSEVIQEMNVTRDILIEHFDKIKNSENNSDCPLCGADWKSYEGLISAIQTKSKKFKGSYDTSTRNFDIEINQLHRDYLVPIINWIDSYLTNNENIIDRKFLYQLKESDKIKEDILAFNKWCQNNNVIIDDFLNKDKKEVLDIEIKKEGLITLLLQKKYQSSAEYSKHDEKKSLYSRIFDNDSKRVRSIELQKIEEKVRYIDYQYYHKSSESIINLKREIQEINIKLDKLERALQKIRAIVQIYEEKIISHWTKIIRDIEIPFYIYSGKIIQDYQRGCGMFIHESDSFGQKSIRFVASIESNHDAINYLSSGQLSGLVIAFTLALNKVYGNDSINMLLIDDPVQTMDEINMASFVELLRNEFREKQIFLSTHEEDISRYMRYKFSKYNLNTQRLNMKNELYSNLNVGE